MSAALILRQAEQLLLGEVDTDVDNSRLAAFLARQALEDLIDQHCAALDAQCYSATTRSKLVVLRALGDREIADAATVAWDRLSAACHHHAYELAPTVEEVRFLCKLVIGLSVGDAHYIV